VKNPFEIFNQWYQKELSCSKLRIPSACCLSTIGEDGYPNSRFVSLKETKNDTFIITGPIHSRKGKEINNTPKVSITFWWTETERQVRVQGNAILISESEAEKYFLKRSQDSKIVSTVFEQGQEIKSISALKSRFNEAKIKFENQYIQKPIQWAGLSIDPIRIEFMEFKKTRLHERILFIKQEGIWEKIYLQP